MQIDSIFLTLSYNTYKKEDTICRHQLFNAPILAYNFGIKNFFTPLPLYIKYVFPTKNPGTYSSKKLVAPHRIIISSTTSNLFPHDTLHVIFPIKSLISRTIDHNVYYKRKNAENQSEAIGAFAH